MAGQQHIVVRAAGSYSTSAVSGALIVRDGTTQIAHQFIHGAGTIEFGAAGQPSATQNQQFVAVLDASGLAGVSGSVSLFGFSVTPGM